RDDRLGHARRAVSRQAQFPARHGAAAHGPEAAVALQADDEDPAGDGAPRPVRLRRSQTPWKVVCLNLDVSVFKGLDTYRGTAQFSNGTVKILSYDEFRADMQTRFRIDGGKIVLEALNLESAGASTDVTGYVDIKNWPEMLYNVKSRIDFSTQKAIYFKDMNFTVAGRG